MKKQEQRKISFIVVCLILILAGRGSAQIRGGIPEKEAIAGLDWKKAKPATGLGLTLTASRIGLFEQQTQPLSFFASVQTPQKMPGAEYYVQHMGFFCKKEWEFEKTAHLPLRFRLGSLENCDWLEGKNK